MSRWTSKRWRVQPDRTAEAERLAGQAGCSPLAARLLLNRGIESSEAAVSFLNPSLDQLADPFLLPDAELAAERLKRALNAKEKITVHGDYDGDGVTSAALWTRLLERLGARVSVHVPHRKRDGYDMRSEFVARAKEEGVALIVTTDCGIRRCDEVEEAREAGIDVVITDHHQPGETLPRAVAVVNPHRPDSRYPYPHLAGVGVAFRMGEALVRHLGHPVGSYRRAFLDLAAIGTTTDVVPMLGENRVIVRFGLGSLRETKREGLRALVALAGLKGPAITARDIGFGIGPRLNAVGRLEDSRAALDLLLTTDSAEAATLAARLEKANAERRQEQDRVLKEVMGKLSGSDWREEFCLLVDGEGWNAGVIGLVASNLVERFHRPALVLAIDPDTGQARGSARSIDGFNLVAAIEACGEYLLDFGGHAHAAGLSMEAGRIEGFCAAMREQAKRSLSEEDLAPTIEADLEAPVESVDFAFLRELADFEPWGMENEQPRIVSRRVRIREVKVIGKDARHLKLLVQRDDGRVVDAVYWGGAELIEHVHPGDSLDLLYKPEINHFNGSSRVQLVVEDLRPPDLDDF